MENKIDVLIAGLKTKRESEGMSIRALADKIGVSFSTLSRLERGEGAPDNNTKIRILSWLGSEAKKLGFEIEEVVQVHFRAAKNVDSKTIRFLSEVAKLAKGQFSNKV